MRIFLSFFQASRDYPLTHYRQWRHYITSGLTEAGQEWIEGDGIDWVELLVDQDPELRRRTWQRAIEQIGEQHRLRKIDLFLSYLFPQQIDEPSLLEIRALGIPCVNFFCDNVREYTTPPAVFRHFDLHWIPEYQALDMYRRAGLPGVYAPMPIWVPPEQRTGGHPETLGTCFVGSWDRLRGELLAKANAGGAPIDIYGADWQPSPGQATPKQAARSWGEKVASRWRFLREQGLAASVWRSLIGWQRDFRPQIPAGRLHGKVSTTEYTRVTREALITLGINRYPSFRRPFWNPDVYSRLRDIEAPMMGACYLTEWAPGLDHLYELGSEIETYRTVDELVDKIARLSADPTKRQELRAKGQRRALGEHTVGQSIAKIAAALNLDTHQRTSVKAASV